MKAYQNKDGSWYVRVYDKNTGKKSTVTGKTEKEVGRLASAWYVQKRRPSALTFGDVLDKYISDRSQILSPSTYREYRRCQARDFDEILPIPIDNITSEVLQTWVNHLMLIPIPSRRKRPDPNAEKKYRSPKSIANIYRLATGALSVYTDRRFRVLIPERYLPEPKMPSEDDVVRLVTYLRDNKDEMYLPVLLALFVPCRRSEICALTSEDLEGNILHIRAAVVQDSEKNWVCKQTKTRRGTRDVAVPSFLAREIRKKKGKLTDMTPNMITSRFPHIAKKVGISCSFHGLRHWSDSFLHKKGLSDQEITSRAGHSAQVFRGTYLHSVGKDRAVKAFESLNFR